MGFNVNDLKKSKFLKRTDVAKPVLVTIESDSEVNVAMEGAEPEMRFALHFKELEKPLVLNSTNGQIIATICGSGNSDDWIGQQIVLYDDPNIFFGGKQTGGIRVRAPKKPANQPVATAKPVPASKSPASCHFPPEAQADLDEDIPF